MLQTQNWIGLRIGQSTKLSQHAQKTKVFSQNSEGPIVDFLSRDSTGGKSDRIKVLVYSCTGSSISKQEICNELH